ncbi:MAG: PTS lactose/cellobiose transporter subunit IIA [Collinsella sp.]
MTVISRRQKAVVEAQAEMSAAHKKQFELTQAEANGEEVDINIIPSTLRTTDNGDYGKRFC